MERSRFVHLLAAGCAGLSVAGPLLRGQPAGAQTSRPPRGNDGPERLSLEALQRWQALEYGMFLHFGMSTFTGKEIDDGRAAASTYHPTALDVGQWIAVARDAGMRYAVLTAKHVAGHCLWPTRCTPYSVAASGERDVVAWFVEECRKKGVRPGLYYCSWDNHNRFGSKTPSDAAYEGAWKDINGFPRDQVDKLPFYTTSLYQAFQTAQIEELLTQYGPIAEVWIDIPGLLGPGYRSFLYQHIAKLQPQAVVMMNCCMDPWYAPEYAFPADIRSFERNRPPGYDGRVSITGSSYYLPGEFCQPIGKEWFHVEGDRPRGLGELEEEFRWCQRNRVNYLLDVPPDKRGLIPEASVAALSSLRAKLGG